MKTARLAVAGILCTLLAMTQPLPAQTSTDATAIRQGPQTPISDYTNRLIVKLRSDRIAGQTLDASRLRQQLKGLSVKMGLDLHYLHPLADGAAVMRLPRRMAVAEVAAIADRLNTHVDVAYAEPDLWMRPLLVPNDPFFSRQWHYYEDTGGIGLPEAWELTTGNSAVVVAIIDTGVLPHADLAGRLLQGYDFISDALVANDGDGRDPNSQDPGDWVTWLESSTVGGLFEGCPAGPSSWHGTHIAGTVGATGNNGLGGTGVNWSARLLPIRVLGKCGGFLSDVVDGMRWAAGLSVPGVPLNTTPAQVLNLSLGGQGECGPTYQAAIRDIIALEKTIVVAAGNENGNVADLSPANCPGVITVAATTRGGGKARYSNTGGLVTISAPGGQQFFASDANGVLSTLNTGRTTPQEDDFRFYQGTSMASAHMSGVIALMLSTNPGLKQAEVVQMLQATARPFPDGSCDTFTCGAGIVTADAAVRAVGTPPLADAGPDQVVGPGAPVNLGGLASDDGEVIGVAWTQIAGAGVTLAGGDTLTPSFIAPLPAGSLGFQLTVTDNVRLQGTDTVHVTVNNLPPVVHPIGAQTVAEQATLRFTVTATDANGIPPLLSARGLPAGAIFDSTTGVFHWPQAGPPGDYQLTVIATDAQDSRLSAQQSVPVTVHAVATGGGGGCSLGRPGTVDPLLPSLMMIALGYLWMRRRLQ